MNVTGVVVSLNLLLSIRSVVLLNVRRRIMNRNDMYKAIRNILVMPISPQAQKQEVYKVLGQGGENGNSYCFV